KGIGGSPITARTASSRVNDAVDTAPEVVELVAARKLVWLLVNIAVMSDFVTMIQDQAQGPRVVLDTPAGYEEGLSEIVTLECCNDPRDRNFRPIAQQR